MVSPSLSISDAYGWTQGLRTGEQQLDTMLLETGLDLRKKHTEFSVPVIFIQGENDNVTPTNLVADYISMIAAPAKKLYVVHNAGHFVMWSHPVEFLDRLGEELRSLAMQRSSAR